MHQMRNSRQPYTSLLVRYRQIVKAAHGMYQKCINRVHGTGIMGADKGARIQRVPKQYTGCIKNVSIWYTGPAKKAPIGAGVSKVYQMDTVAQAAA